MDTVLFVNATIGFSENLFLVLILSRLSDSAPGKRGSYFQAQALYLSLRTSKGVNTRQICSARSQTQFINIVTLE